MEDAAIILAILWAAGVIWLARQIRLAPYGHQVPGIGFIYDIEDTPSHCVECNEWVTNRCGRERCPFASQPVDDAPDGHPNGDRFTGPLSSLHSTTNSAEAQHDHAR